MSCFTALMRSSPLRIANAVPGSRPDQFAPATIFGGGEVKGRFAAEMTPWLIAVSLMWVGSTVLLEINPVG